MLAPSPNNPTNPFDPKGCALFQIETMGVRTEEASKLRGKPRDEKKRIWILGGFTP